MPDSINSRKIPVFWFGVILLLWVASYWVAFGIDAGREEKIDAFMSSGERFTQAEDALATRVFLLELQVEELYRGGRD